MSSVLILNSNYSPLGTVSWQRAVILMFEGKVEVLEEYKDKKIRSVSLTIKMPSVVRLIKWIKGKLVGIRFNKSNIFLRDKGRCQYCGKGISLSKATYDHVIPKSRNGKTNWDNIVTCCSPCNQNKDARTPSEAGMTLKSIPVKPSNLPIELGFSLRYRNKFPEAWKNYVKIDNNLD